MPGTSAATPCCSCFSRASASSSSTTSTTLLRSPSSASPSSPDTTVATSSSTREDAYAMVETELEKREVDDSSFRGQFPSLGTKEDAVFLLTLIRAIAMHKKRLWIWCRSVKWEDMTYYLDLQSSVLHPQLPAYIALKEYDGKIACAAPGEARKWIEAFEQAKQ